MAKKKVKKVDVKKVAKLSVMEVVANALKDAGYEVHEGLDFGFTEGTVVCRTEKCDVQIKPITPKAGVDFYELLTDEEEEDEEEFEDEATEEESITE